MKILLIARPFVFHGGVERATAGLVGALVEHGHRVEVLSPGDQAPLRGIRVHRLRLPPLPPTARLLALVAAARLVVARGRWDVVQSHERTLAQDVYRAGEGCHRAYLATAGQGGGRRLYHRVVLALERRLFARTPRIVAIARLGRAEIESWYGVPPARLAVVFNGVDLDRFHPRNRGVHGAGARAEVGVPVEARVALFVGSGFERKGLATAIAALAAERAAAHVLLVVGKGRTGPYQELAERLGVATRVVWLGPRPDPERWYGAADVVILPTRYEPFGNVHLEALASGVPVLTSRRAGGAELITDGVNGWVGDPRDAEGFAAAMERFRACPWKDLSEAARRSAEPFTYAAQVAAFMNVYRSLPAPRGENP